MAFLTPGISNVMFLACICWIYFWLFVKKNTYLDLKPIAWIVNSHFSQVVILFRPLTAILNFELDFKPLSNRARTLWKLPSRSSIRTKTIYRNTYWSDFHENNEIVGSYWHVPFKFWFKIISTLIAGAMSEDTLFSKCNHELCFWLPRLHRLGPFSRKLYSSHSRNVSESNFDENKYTIHSHRGWFNCSSTLKFFEKWSFNLLKPIGDSFEFDSLYWRQLAHVCETIITKIKLQVVPKFQPVLNCPIEFWQNLLLVI